MPQIDITIMKASAVTQLQFAKYTPETFDKALNAKKLEIANNVQKALAEKVYGFKPVDILSKLNIPVIVAPEGTFFQNEGGVAPAMTAESKGNRALILNSDFIGNLEKPSYKTKRFIAEEIIHIAAGTLGLDTSPEWQEAFKKHEARDKQSLEKAIGFLYAEFASGKSDGLGKGPYVMYQQMHAEELIKTEMLLKAMDGITDKYSGFIGAAKLFFDKNTQKQVDTIKGGRDKIVEKISDLKGQLETIGAIEILPDLFHAKYFHRSGNLMVTEANADAKIRTHFPMMFDIFKGLENTMINNKFPDVARNDSETIKADLLQKYESQSTAVKKIMVQNEVTQGKFK